MTQPIVVGGAVRFTAICSELIRIEYAPSGRFIDEPTLFVVCRSYPDFTFSVDRRPGAVTIETACLTLTYTGDGEKPTAENLKILVKDTCVEWKPGDEDDRNLGGPLQTLDACDGPLPLSDGLLSRAGWRLIDDSRGHLLVDDWIEQRLLDRSILDWYFFGYGRNYKAALQALSTVSGKVPLPRKHIFGSWYCRWHAYTSDDYRQLVQEYKDHDFPLDIMVFDMDWHKKDGVTGFGHGYRSMGWTGFSWNRDLLPDVERLLEEFRNDRIFVTMNIHPHDGVRATEDMYPEFMRELGYDPSEKKDLPFLAGDRDYMAAYFKYTHTPHEAIGVDFWWVDWQQDDIMPFVNHIPWLKHLPWLNHLYFEHSTESGKRGLGFSRWAGWGDHRYPIHFSGDTQAIWPVLGFEVFFTIASGNAGCFFWAHDTGGFYGGDRDQELYTRWVQFCTLSATLRLHSVGDNLDRRPWLWGEPFISIMRDAYRLRSILTPYVYTSAWQSHRHTTPLLRGMYLEYPEAKEAYEFPTQYLFGDHLLVSPVVKKGENGDGVVTQEVWFPEGEWRHWFTGQVVEGPAVKEVTTPLNEIPLWVRAGAPIPMQPYANRMTTESLTTLVLRCTSSVREGEICSVLYEDDGQTADYLDGRCATTSLRQVTSADGAAIAIGATEGMFEGQLETRAAEIHWHGPRKIASATENGESLAILEADGVQVIKLASASIRTARQLAIRLA